MTEREIAEMEIEKLYKELSKSHTLEKLKKKELD